jgi:hypothetical protein
MCSVLVSFPLYSVISVTMEIWGKMDLTKEETEEGRGADETEGCGEEIFTGEHQPLAISSTSTKRPPPEPPPQAVMTTRKGRLKLQHFSILQKTEFGLLPLDLSLERPPRKPPDEVRITLLPPISSLSRPPPKPPWVILDWVCLMLFCFCSVFCLFVVVFVCLLCSVSSLCCSVVCVLPLSLVGFKHWPQLRFDCSYHTSFVAFYEDDSRFNPFAFYRLISVQSDKVKKSETKYSRNVRDEAKKMIRNWMGKKTLGSHISFVTFRRWKMLMNGLLGCELWSNFSYLSTKFMCIVNHDLVGYFSCIDSSSLLGNVPSMSTLAGCNILCFMKC